MGGEEWGGVGEDGRVGLGEDEGAGAVASGGGRRRHWWRGGGGGGWGWGWRVFWWPFLVERLRDNGFDSSSDLLQHGGLFI